MWLEDFFLLLIKTILILRIPYSFTFINKTFGKKIIKWVIYTQSCEFLRLLLSSFEKKITFMNALECWDVYSSNLYSHLSASFELRWCFKSLCLCFPALHKLVLWLTNIILSLRKWMLFSIILSGIIKTIIRYRTLINFFPSKLEHSSYPKGSMNFLWSQNRKCKGKPGVKTLIPTICIFLEWSS